MTSVPTKKTPTKKTPTKTPTNVPTIATKIPTNDKVATNEVTNEYILVTVADQDDRYNHEANVHTFLIPPDIYNSMDFKRRIHLESRSLERCDGEECGFNCNKKGGRGKGLCDFFSQFTVEYMLNKSIKIIGEDEHEELWCHADSDNDDDNE